MHTASILLLNVCVCFVYRWDRADEQWIRYIHVCAVVASLSLRLAISYLARMCAACVWCARSCIACRQFDFRLNICNLVCSNLQSRLGSSQRVQLCVPGTVQVKIRDLPVMDKRSELTDAVVEVKRTLIPRSNLYNAYMYMYTSRRYLSSTMLYLSVNVTDKWFSWIWPSVLFCIYIYIRCTWTFWGKKPTVHDL